MLFNHISVHLLYHLTNFHEPHRCFFAHRGPEALSSDGRWWAIHGNGYPFMRSFMDFHGFSCFFLIFMDFDPLYMETDGFGSTLGHRHLADFHPFWMFFFGSFCNILQCKLRNMVCGKFCRHVAGPGSFQLCSTLGRLFGDETQLSYFSSVSHVGFLVSWRFRVSREHLRSFEHLAMRFAICKHWPNMEYIWGFWSRKSTHNWMVSFMLSMS